MSLKYCPDVWKTMYVSKIDHQNVDLGFCCVNSLKRSSTADWNSVIDDKRKNFIDNDSPVQCQYCWSLEKSGGISKRTQDLNWYKNNGIETDTEVKLVSLEWNCENLCNLACITCGPIFSSRWASEIVKYPWSDVHTHKPSDKNLFYELLDFSCLRRVYFNGGEPLMTLDHIGILKKLRREKRLSECEVSYNTNGTVIPDAECLDLWKEARLVRISMSIDATDNNFEFIRWPAKWQQILDFIDFVFSQPFNIILDITCTVGIHNVFSLKDLHKWYTKTCPVNHQSDPVSFNIQSVGNISHGGRVLSLNNIGRNLSQIAKEHLIELNQQIDVNHLIIMCDSADGDDKNWKDYLDNLSRQRKMDWQKSLPELADEYHKIS